MNRTGMSGRRVLVTGASGFIGQHLCQNLLTSGATVFAVSRAPKPGPDSTARWLAADVSDSREALRVVNEVKPEIIYHLASHVSGSRALAAVEPSFFGNLASTVHLLVAATASKVGRMVIAGSLEEPAPGEAFAIPASPYAAAKAAASSYARMFHALYGTPVVVARLFMVYGPGQSDLNKLVPYVTTSLLRGESPALSSGEREVDWIYVADAASGLALLGDTQGIDGETIDLGSGTLVRVRAVAEMLGGIVAPDVKLGFGDVAERPMEQVRVADAAGAEKRVGFRAVVTLGDGLQRTADWYRERARGQAAG